MIDMEKYKRIAAERVGSGQAIPGKLGGKTAIVTGAAQGLGLGIAQALYREGANVVIADLKENSLGERSMWVKTDVSNEQSVAELVAKTVTKFGGIDLFINNAGVLKAGALNELEYEDFAFVTRINYQAYFLCVKYVSEIMKAQYAADNSWTGDIIEINSKSGLEGSNKNSAYAGSKFGGVGLTASFALELCPYNIKVNAICPGNFLDGPLWSDPDRGLFVQYLKAGKVPGAKTVADVRAYYEAKVPMGRGCYPEDIAKAIFYAIEQSYETGQAIPVTGGQIMLH